MYLDPGSGSVILQTVLASLLGLGVITRIFWKKIKSLGGKKELENVEIEDKDKTDEID